MISNKVFDAEKRIFPIGRGCGVILFFIGMAPVGTNIVYCLDDKTFQLTSVKGALNLGAAAGLLILLLISLGDVILYSFKIRSPIFRICRSMIIDEKVDFLKKARSNVDFIIFFGLLQFICVGGAAFFLGWKKFKSSDLMCQYIPMGLVSLMGLMSLIFKLCLAANGKDCVNIYPRRNVPFFINSTPGVSDIGLFQVTFVLFVVPALAALALAGKFGFSKFSNQNMKSDSVFWQVLMAGILFVLFIIVANTVTYLQKGRKTLDFALKRSFINDRDAYELSKVKQALTATSMTQMFVFIFGFLAASAALLRNESIITDIASGESGRKHTAEISLVASLCLISLSSILVFLIQEEVKKSFLRCSVFQIDKNIMILNRNSGI